MSEPLRLLLACGIGGALCAAIVALAPGWLKTRSSSVTAWAWAVGAGVGLLAAYRLMEGASAFQAPFPSHQWIWLALLPAAAIIGGLDSLPRFPRLAAWGLRLGLILAAPPLLLRSYYLNGEYSQWDSLSAAGWLAAITLLTGAVWLAVQLLLRVDSRRIDGFCLIGCLGVVAGVCLTSGSARLGVLALASFVVLLAGWAASWRHAADQGVRVLGDVAAVLLVGLLINAYFYASAQAPHVLLVGLAPLGLLVGLTPFVQRRHRAVQAGARLLAVLLPTMLALGLAIARFVADQRDAAASPWG